MHLKQKIRRRTFSAQRKSSMGWQVKRLTRRKRKSKERIFDIKKIARPDHWDLEAPYPRTTLFNGFSCLYISYQRETFPAK